MFRIRAFPAGHGDCLVIEYGSAAAPSRVLIDGGTKGTYERLAPYLNALPAPRRFELLIVTHVDADHIDGVLKLIDPARAPVSFDDIWFNGYRHLSGLEEFGPVAGERLTTYLLTPPPKWNVAFAGKPVAVPDAGPPPVRTLAGGLRLTVLSPYTKQLKRLKDEWKELCEEAGLDPVKQAKEPIPLPPGIEVFGPPNVAKLAATQFAEDTAKANGSSIAVLAEFDGKRALLTGDAYPSVLLASLDRLAPGPLQKVDVFKLPHHGSEANIDQALLAKAPAKRYLVSTNGAYFQHPDKVAIARVIKNGGGGELIFNYTSKHNSIWSSSALQSQHGYTASYPPADDAGCVIDL